MTVTVQARGRARVGTSGWSYPHWIGPVYPEGVAGGQMLAHYALSLDTVEIDGTFYRLPSTSTVGQWRAQVPPGFLFAVKASRYVTHMKKLRDPRVATRRLFAAIASLGDRLGPILFQLPPRWRVNPERLSAFVAALPRGLRYAFEFRDPSWYCDEVVAALTAHGAALCIHDFAGSASPAVATADFVYVRLHGAGGTYAGRYGRRRLRPWAERLTAWQSGGLDVHVYFNNDAQGHAFHDALALKAMLGADPGDPPATERSLSISESPPCHTQRSVSGRACSKACSTFRTTRRESSCSPMAAAAAG